MANTDYDISNKPVSGLEIRMAVLTMAFILGILTFEFLPAVISIFIGLSLFLISVLFFSQSLNGAAMFVAALFLLGIARYTISKEIAVNDISRYIGISNEVIGYVAEDPDVRPGKTTIKLNAYMIKSNNGWQKVSGKVLVNIYNDKSKMPKVEYGDKLKLRTRLYSPIEPTNPNQFSYKNYLARQNIYACMSVKYNKQIFILPGNTGNGLYKFAYNVKQSIQSNIKKVCKPEEASVISSMILGNYAYLSSDTYTNFSKTGTLHLLAASGFNCFIIYILLNPILMILRINIKWRSFIIIFCLIIYLLMVGFKASILRATIMASLALLAIPLGKIKSYKNLLFVSAFIVLMINPSSLFDVGFLLSFAGVASLIYLNPITEIILFRKNIFRKSTNILKSTLLETGISTFTISIATTPLIAYNFNYISLVSLPCNLALALFAPIIFAMGVLTAVTASVPYIGDASGFASSEITKAALWIVNYMGSLKYSAIACVSPDLFLIFGYYVLLYLAIIYLAGKYEQE